MLLRRIKKEFAIIPYTTKGYTRKTASHWVNRKRTDNKLYKDVYSASEINNAHAKGFRARSLANFSNDDMRNYISDLDYLAMQPVNNSYAKWIGDANTFKRVYEDTFKIVPNIYFTFFRRKEVYINTWPMATEKITAQDVYEFIKNNPEKHFELRPSFFQSKRDRLEIIYKDEGVLVEGEYRDKEAFIQLIEDLHANYILCDRINYIKLREENNDKRYFIKVYVANDVEDNILSAVLEEVDVVSKNGNQFMINVENGHIGEKNLKLECWDKIKEAAEDVADKLKQIRFFTLSFTADKNGEIRIISANARPILPIIPYNEELVAYLERLNVERKNKKIPFSTKWAAIKRNLFAKWVKKFCKKGMRPYMQKLWMYAKWEDMKWKGTTMKEKKWAWKHGFLSYRIDQYNLNEENCKKYLADYQYHWLNRINGLFQLWINDKTTFRYVMDPFKEIIPKYYFSVFRYHKDMVIEKMMDCPEGIGTDVEGIIQLLKQEKKLVFKASAGTHGDGFYCFEYDGENFYANGKEKTEDEIKNTIVSQKSYYIVTSYINMHSELKKIYPTSVNTIRMGVINREGYNPKIMQTYMRIGSSKTGYTDNVGYGGICAMVDTETGRLYNPEKLVDHKYYPCEYHPDTNLEISTVTVPNWEIICREVLNVCRLMPELEFLGFDVAVTEDSFEIVEINIHQDLHKVAQYSEEYQEWFREKAAYKAERYGIK